MARVRGQDSVRVPEVRGRHGGRRQPVRDRLGHQRGHQGEEIHEENHLKH